ncbi:MAG: hypothetical protein A2046_04290 [Bacteroidetes bacterium GWA2_30_7]|nr:MAG: hypothetical protein A2046_04290 [Bacteroidetes bacterium GWA2_30_7]
MDKFLKFVAKDLYDKHKNNFQELCLVFPNIRSSLFFKAYLSEIISNPIWTPTFTTINNEIKKHSNFIEADELILLAELFEVYALITKSQEKFDDFYYWGKILLADFNEIDKNRVNANKLFINISEIHKIEDNFEYLTSEQIEAIKYFWNSFNISKSSNEKDNFKTLWDLLSDIYTIFKKNLSAQGIAYEGMIYRDVIENNLSKIELLMPFKKVIFIGFNALDKCEIEFTKHIKSLKKALFYWDYDNYYLKNINHEAGYFIRNNLNLFDNELKNNELFESFNIPKEIKIIPVPNKISETKITSTIINELISENKINTKKFDNTAIILADEKNLVPLIYSLPAKLDSVNITMGYPVTNSYIYSFILNILEVYTENFNKNKLYSKHIINIFNNKYLKNKKSENFVYKIISDNIIYLTTSDLKDFPVWNEFFENDLTLENLINLLSSIFNEIIKNKEGFNIDYEATLCIINELKKLEAVLISLKIGFQNKTLVNIIKTHLSFLRIPFEGEPLSGMQIMGILETRLLDFDNLIVLSANEGIISGNINPTSYIPYNIRKGFGLPTIEQYEAIHSYYFYRLIQRAKNIYFVYNNDIYGVNTGEMSRYLHQLKYETVHELIEKSISLVPEIQSKRIISKQKDTESINILSKYITDENKFLSPSAIYTYIECQLKFYFKYIAKIKEPEMLTEDIDGMMFGSLFHNTVYAIYKDFEGKTIEKSDIEKILSDSHVIDSKLMQSFKDLNLASDNQLHGRNILIFEVLKKYIFQLLEIDKQYSPFEITALEKSVSKFFALQIDNESKKIKIGGIIDRIDLKNGITRIIDYKSGSDKKNIAELSHLFDGEHDNLKGFFQLLFYTMISKDNLNLINPVIFSINTFFSENSDNNLSIGVRDNKEIIDSNHKIFEEFELNLKSILANIFSPDFNFNQTENEKTCKYCTFNNICFKK